MPIGPIGKQPKRSRRGPVLTDKRRAPSLWCTACALLSALIAAWPADIKAQNDPSRRDITIGLISEPPHLDPVASNSPAIDEIVHLNLFEGLTRFDEDGAILPALAEKWEIKDDGQRYSFNLRRNVRFHDGTPFDAEDVRYSIERLKTEQKNPILRDFFRVIQEIKVVSSYRVDLILSRPEARLLAHLGLSDAVILSAQPGQHPYAQPNGTGPFRFKSWEPEVKLLLERNDDYWGAPPYMERITFRFISDPAQAAVALKSGEIDAFPNFPDYKQLSLLAADPQLSVVFGHAAEGVVLVMNNGRQPFNDFFVRQAIAHAINRQDIISRAMSGRVVPVSSHFAPSHENYVSLIGLYTYNPERARNLLKSSGYENVEITLKLPPPSYARRSATIVREQLQAIGIKVIIKNLEWQEWFEQVFLNRDYDMTIIAHSEPLFISNYGREDNYFNYINEEVARLVAQLAREGNNQIRSSILQRLQRKIAEDAVNIFLFQLAKQSVWNVRLSGLWAHAPVPANDMTKARWRHDSPLRSHSKIPPLPQIGALPVLYRQPTFLSQHQR